MCSRETIGGNSSEMNLNILLSSSAESRAQKFQSALSAPLRSCIKVGDDGKQAKSVSWAKSFRRVDKSRLRRQIQFR